MLASLTLALGGCAWMHGDLFRRHAQQASTPLVEFLYGDGEVPVTDAQPELHLPIRVALSFLPRAGGPSAFQAGAIDREKVLTAIRENFRTLPYVTEIIIVPDYYLKGGNGDGLMQIEQLARLFHFDLLALVSYDQIQNTYQNERSLAYLTIVGAYLVRGDRKETHTLLDLAVIDPASRGLVLRAGGVSVLKESATPLDATRRGAAQSSRGFELATSELVANFSRELTDFEQRVRNGTAPVKVVRQASKSGGGALDPLLLICLIAILAWRGMRSSASARRSARD
jgi:rhombotail lipoprotein